MPDEHPETTKLIGTGSNLEPKAMNKARKSDSIDENDYYTAEDVKYLRGALQQVPNGLIENSQAHFSQSKSLSSHDLSRVSFQELFSMG